MATDYSNTLDLYKQLQKNGAEHVDASLSAPPVIGSSLEELNEAVFGDYDDSLDNAKNDGNDLLLETMKQIESGNLSETNKKRIEDNVKNSKIPSAILEEMISNPLINTKVGKDDVDDFIDTIFKSSAGIQKSSKIIERVENEGKKKSEARKPLNEKNSYSEHIDYDRIAMIVEGIVSEKFSEYSKKHLYENKTNPFNGVKVVQLKENGSFLMLDSDNNVYECSLKYKGKNKKRN